MKKNWFNSRMFTPKRVSRIGSRLSLSSPRASPAASSRKTTVPVQISELINSRNFDDLDGNVLNCGFACITTSDTIFCWKVSQRSQVHQLPVPAGCHAKVFLIFNYNHILLFALIFGRSVSTFVIP